MIDTDRRRSPADLRNVLEVRVRRQATTYAHDARREALVEIRELADTAIAHLDDEDDR